MAQRKTKLTIGAVIGSIPVAVGGAWALATTAADHVMAPHVADARQRVHVMCEWAKVQNHNTTQICDALGAKCKVLPADVLVGAGCYEDGK